MHGLCADVRFQPCPWQASLMGYSVLLHLPLDPPSTQYSWNLLPIQWSWHFIPQFFHCMEYTLHPKNVEVTSASAPVLFLNFWCILADFHCVFCPCAFSKLMEAGTCSIHRGQKFHGINTLRSSLKCCGINTPAPLPFGQDNQEASLMKPPRIFPWGETPFAHCGNC